MQQLSIVYFASRDPQMPGMLRWLAIGIVAYALSPIDLIPDFIPVLGLLDDLILLPAGIALVLKLIPVGINERAQLRAQQPVNTTESRWVILVIVALWCLLIGGLIYWLV